MKTEVVKAYWYSIYEGFVTKERKDEVPTEVAYFMKITDGKEVVWCKIGNTQNQNWYVDEDN